MSSRWPGPRNEVRALDAWIKLNRSVESVGRHLRAAVEEANLTHGQFAVLEALLHVGPQGAGELAARVLRSPANLTTVIDNLERDGLVERVRSDEDRRAVRLSLTTAGRRTIERVMPAHVAAITDAMSGLTAGEQDDLARLCRKLGLAAAGTEPAAPRAPAVARKRGR